MGKSGFIIRLIDVAMIILFGFIAISDIKVRAQIKLPSQEEEQQPEMKREPELIFVEIGMTNQFNIKHGDETVAVVTEPAEIETALVKLSEAFKADGKKMVVLIEPHEESPIQFTVDVLDMCERHNIPKNINYESMQF